MYRVVIPVFPGVEELDAVGPFEVFALAAEKDSSVEVVLANATPGSEVRCAHGMCLGDLPVFEPRGGWDLIVVPGGAWITGGETGVRRMVSDGVLAPKLAEAAALGATVSSVCTGAFLLEAAGLLAGLPATTHTAAIADLRALGVESVEGYRVVDCGKVVTAGGITSGLDLGLWMLRRDVDPGLAGRVAETLNYPVPERVFRGGC